MKASEINLNRFLSQTRNLSSLAKFERIQGALSLFDAEEDLNIQYVN